MRRLLKTQPARLVPPCGHIAGIYSRSDARIGVHKAPANELMEDVLKLEIDYSDDELAELNDSGSQLPARHTRWRNSCLGRTNTERTAAVVICQCKTLVSDINPMDQKEHG